MKSGIPSKLTLVDRNGQEIPGQQGYDGMAVEYQASPADREDDAAGGGLGSAAERARKNRLVVLAVVSASCAAAAVASGSYAFFLSRRKIADEALTSVHDILKTCQDRVSRMEAELSQLTPRSTASS